MPTNIFRRRSVIAGIVITAFLLTSCGDPADHEVAPAANTATPGSVGGSESAGSPPAAHLIADGTYQQVLDKWGLGSEAVEAAEINPPGLPKPTSG